MALVSAKIPKVHPAEPSIRATASRTSITVRGSASSPPSSLGQMERSKRVLRRASRGGFIETAELFRLWRVLRQDWRHRFDFRQQLVSQRLVGLHATLLSSRSRIRNDPNQRPPSRRECDRAWLPPGLNFPLIARRSRCLTPPA